MFRWMMLVILILSLSLFASCGSSESSQWQDAEALATTYLEHLKAGRFSEAYALHGGDSQLVKSTTDEAFTRIHQDAKSATPALFGFDFKLTPQTQTSTRAGLFEFKAELSWKDGYPFPEGKEADANSVLTPEMRVTVKIVNEQARIFVARRWYNLADEMKKTK